jgi:hypothetical protein
MEALFYLKYGLLNVEVADLVMGGEGVSHGMVESLIKFQLQMGKEDGCIHTSTFCLRSAV